MHITETIIYILRVSNAESQWNILNLVSISKKKTKKRKLRKLFNQLIYYSMEYECQFVYLMVGWNIDVKWRGQEGFEIRMYVYICDIMLKNQSPKFQWQLKNNVEYAALLIEFIFLLVTVL